MGLYQQFIIRIYINGNGFTEEIDGILNIRKKKTRNDVIIEKGILRICIGLDDI